MFIEQNDGSFILALPGDVRLIVAHDHNGWEASMFEPDQTGGGTRSGVFTCYWGTKERAAEGITGLYRAEMLRRATAPIETLAAFGGSRLSSGA